MLRQQAEAAGLDYSFCGDDLKLNRTSPQTFVTWCYQRATVIVTGELRLSQQLPPRLWRCLLICLYHWTLSR